MQCSRCGYMMSPLDKECLKCRNSSYSAPVVAPPMQPGTPPPSGPVFDLSQPGTTFPGTTASPGSGVPGYGATPGYGNPVSPQSPYGYPAAPGRPLYSPPNSITPQKETARSSWSGWGGDSMSPWWKFRIAVGLIAVVLRIVFWTTNSGQNSRPVVINTPSQSMNVPTPRPVTVYTSTSYPPTSRGSSASYNNAQESQRRMMEMQQQHQQRMMEQQQRIQQIQQQNQQRMMEQQQNIQQMQQQNQQRVMEMQQQNQQRIQQMQQQNRPGF